jgi:osmoprotectant transport system permease protein
VAAFGAVVALAGCLLLPFVEFRPNRIVSGTPESVLVAGAAGWVLIGLAAMALVAALLPQRQRGPLLLAAGAGTGLSLLWSLGVAAIDLQDGAPAIARVSIGSGAWLAGLGALVIWFAGTRATASATARRTAGVLALAGLAAIVFWGGLSELSIAREYAVQSRRFWMLVRQHLVLAGAGVGFGVLCGIPLGVFASRNRVVRDVGLGIVSVIQTIPSMAMLGLLIAPLAALGLQAIGTTPAVIALTLYALLPIMRNTFVGLTGVDPGVIDAGRGMGMGRFQLLLRVEAPLALPLVIEGVRAAAVLVIGIAAVTAFIGAGGLGILVFQGWGQQADDLTLLGAIPMVVLAVVADVSMRGLRRIVVSPGIEEGTLT